jgi:hypothetical protein
MSTKPGLYANIHAKRERIKAGSGEKMRRGWQLRVPPLPRLLSSLHAQPSVKVNPPPLSHRVDPAVFLPRRVFFRGQLTCSIQSAPQRTVLESRTCYPAS